MVKRSLQASREGTERAETALIGLRLNQTRLAAALTVDRKPIGNFFGGRPVDREIFVRICEHLKLDWQVIAISKEASEEEITEVDALVQSVREEIKPFIQERCGSMKVLDMTQPIGLDSIYTDVNILERITGRMGRDIADLMQNASLENFDRFCIGKVKEKRVPGLEAVEKFPKLMILGKPGAGKTTFLKHLAMQCIGGAFQRERVPFFITLKEFAEEPGKLGVLEYCQQKLVGRGAENLEILLENGRVLLLLDGLDEVRDTDASRVLQQIQQVSRQFPANQFVITCRIAAQEYTFEQFTEVEVADFNEAQIADFVQKWFQHKNDTVKAEQFLSKLKAEKPIRELAASPLLLTLLCLVFEDSGSFPSNRAELYGRGVDVLLTKWDAKRNIERGQVYQGLSLKRKKALLSWVARATFEAGNYFFKQREVERVIDGYILNLPNADSAALEVDSAAVLRSIEAQHGLFVERAQGIYSFSHLTFHEYFTAREFAERRDLAGLATHITDPRWREVFLLAVQYLFNNADANALLRLMKTQIDQLLAGDEPLQGFLRWVNEKTRSVDASYKPAAVRAFYFALDRALALALALDRALALAVLHDIAVFHDLNLAVLHDIAVFHDLNHAYALDRALDHALDRALDHALVRDRVLDHALNLVLDLDPELHRKLQALCDRLPPKSLSKDDRHQWWEENGEAWAAELRAVMIEHRNIGHDWQFSEAQIQRLQAYYDANQLLVDCLNSECYVSREVRQEIEATLLLPLSEIERWRATD